MQTNENIYKIACRSLMESANHTQACNGISINLSVVANAHGSDIDECSELWIVLCS